MNNLENIIKFNRSKRYYLKNHRKKLSPRNLKFKFKKIINRKKLVHPKKLPRRSEGDDEPIYVIYCIVNSKYFRDRCGMVASVARGLLNLYNQMYNNLVKARDLEIWENSGERLVVAKGIDQRHLKYLANELRCITVDVHKLCKRQSILVLSVFGRKEALDDVLDQLPVLK